MAFIVQESALILKELKEALWIGRSTRWQEETKNHNIKNTKKQIRILKKSEKKIQKSQQGGRRSQRIRNKLAKL